MLENNVSREEMADVIGTCKRTFDKIMTRQREAKPTEVILMAEKLGVEPEDLQYREPKTVFKHCNNNGFYNQGQLHFEAGEELQKLHGSLLQHEQALLAEKDKVIQQKDEIIATQQQVILQLQQTIEAMRKPSH